MRLVAAVLGFLLKKFGAFVAVVACLFLGLMLMSALIPAIQQAEAGRDRLQEVTQERADLEDELAELETSYAEAQGVAVDGLKRRVDAEMAEVRTTVSQQRSDRDDLHAREDEVCGMWTRLPELVLPGPNPCEAAQRAAEAADEALATVEANLARAEADAEVLADPDLTNDQKLERLGEDGDLAPVTRDIDNTEADLARTKAEEKGLRDAQASWAGRVVNLWARSWKWLIGVAVVVILLPFVLRTVNYFVLMPLVARAQRRVRLSADLEGSTAELRTSPAQRILTVELGEGEVLSARHEHVRPVQGKTRGRIIYDWSSPFISFAAGLYFLSRLTGDVEVTSATLASPDADAYLMRIDLQDHPGLVVHPKHVVGVIGAPELLTRWRWGIQSFATWQVRYIMFAGTGSVIVEGLGDVATMNPQGRSTRMEQNLVMGFDSRLTIGVNRTEVFIPYLRGTEPLVDDEFTGDHLFFWQKSSPEVSENPLTRTFNAMFSALGKLLGF